MGEAFYLFGVMLMLLDNLIIGPVREKIIIAYFRYKVLNYYKQLKNFLKLFLFKKGGQSAIDNINEVVKLCKKTDYLPAKYSVTGIATRPKNYPEEFFSRFKISCN